MNEIITNIILSHDNVMLRRQYHFNIMCDYPTWRDIMEKLVTDFNSSKQLTIHSISERIKESDGTTISTKFNFLTNYRYEINKTQINGEEVNEEWGMYCIAEEYRDYIKLYVGD